MAPFFVGTPLGNSLHQKHCFGEVSMEEIDAEMGRWWVLLSLEYIDYKQEHSRSLTPY